MIRCRSVLCYLVLSSFFAAGALAQKESAIRNVFWQPNELQNGSVVFFGVEFNREATQVTGTFLHKELVFFKAVDRPWRPAS